MDLHAFLSKQQMLNVHVLSRNCYSNNKQFKKIEFPVKITCNVLGRTVHVLIFLFFIIPKDVIVHDIQCPF